MQSSATYNAWNTNVSSTSENGLGQTRGPARATPNNRWRNGQGLQPGNAQATGSNRRVPSVAVAGLAINVIMQGNDGQWYQVTPSNTNQCGKTWAIMKDQHTAGLEFQQQQRTNMTNIPLGHVQSVQSSAFGIVSPQQQQQSFHGQQSSFGQQPSAFGQQPSFNQQPQQPSFNQQPQQTSFNQQPQQTSFNQQPQQTSFNQHTSFNQQPQQAFYNNGISAQFQLVPQQPTFHFTNSPSHNTTPYWDMNQAFPNEQNDYDGDILMFCSEKKQLVGHVCPCQKKHVNQKCPILIRKRAEQNFTASSGMGNSFAAHTSSWGR